MIALVGLLLIAASVVVFWRLLPSEGKVHRLATAPFLESIISICIVAGFAVGVALEFAGLTIWQGAHMKPLDTMELKDRPYFPYPSDPGTRLGFIIADLISASIIILIMYVTLKSTLRF
jgi:hypothetical protein